MSAVLEAENISVRYGGVAAVSAVDITVAEGVLLGLIGPNGAGKTTLFRVITGVVAPRSGSVRLAGENISKLPPHMRARRGIGLSHQLVRPFKNMTAGQNVALAIGSEKTRYPWKALLHMNRREETERARALLGMVGIAQVADRAVTTLPLGSLKRLEVARALAIEPKVLLLDEPLAGLNHQEAAAMADTIARINRTGLTVVLIEHNLGEVMRVCQQLVVLDGGRKIAEGEPEHVIAQADVRAAYLGMDRANAAR